MQAPIPNWQIFRSSHKTWRLHWEPFVQAADSAAKHLPAAPAKYRRALQRVRGQQLSIGNIPMGGLPIIMLCAVGQRNTEQIHILRIFVGHDRIAFRLQQTQIQKDRTHFFRCVVANMDQLLVIPCNDIYLGHRSINRSCVISPTAEHESRAQKDDPKKFC